MNAGSVWKAVISTARIYHLSGSRPTRDIPVYGTPASSAASSDTGDVCRAVINSKMNNEPGRESETINEKGIME